MIYFAQCELPNLIKIGFSENVERRLDYLSANGTRPLRLLLCVRWGSISEEKIIHGILHQYRVASEWFAPAPEVFAFMESLKEFTQFYEGERRQFFRELRKQLEWDGSRGMFVPLIPKTWKEILAANPPHPPKLTEEQLERLAQADRNAYMTGCFENPAMFGFRPSPEPTGPEWLRPTLGVEKDRSK